jgi:hypothetical protein
MGKLCRISAPNKSKASSDKRKALEHVIRRYFPICANRGKPKDAVPGKTVRMQKAIDRISQALFLPEIARSALASSAYLLDEQ